MNDYKLQESLINSYLPDVKCRSFFDLSPKEMFKLASAIKSGYRFWTILTLLAIGNLLVMLYFFPSDVIVLLMFKIILCTVTIILSLLGLIGVWVTKSGLKEIYKNADAFFRGWIYDFNNRTQDWQIYDLLLAGNIIKAKRYIQQVAELEEDDPERWVI